MYVLVVVFAVERRKDGRDHLMLLRYDSVPASKEEEEEEEEEEGNVYETTEFLEKPPSYQELRRTK